MIRHPCVIPCSAAHVMKVQKRSPAGTSSKTHGAAPGQNCARAGLERIARIANDVSSNSLRIEASLSLVLAAADVDGGGPSASLGPALAAVRGPPVKQVDALANCRYFPTMMSEDLMTADTLSPCLSARSSTASTVIAT